MIQMNLRTFKVNIINFKRCSIRQDENIIRALFSSVIYSNLTSRAVNVIGAVVRFNLDEFSLIPELNRIASFNSEISCPSVEGGFVTWSRWGEDKVMGCSSLQVNSIRASFGTRHNRIHGAYIFYYTSLVIRLEHKFKGVGFNEFPFRVDLRYVKSQI